MTRERDSDGLIMPSRTDMLPVGVQQRGKIILANTFGPDAQLYSQRNLDMQRRYLKLAGYKGTVLNLAVNKLHDMHAEPSDLYFEDGVHGYNATRVEAPGCRGYRAIDVTVVDADRLREHALERVGPFNSMARVAAAELMLKLTGLPTLHES